jgi:adenylate kinase family enzyme
MKSLSLSQPHVIVMVGAPGSGKSFFAEKFSETFNAPFASLEKIIPFAKSATAANTLFEQQVEELLKTRQSLVIEGITASRVARDAFARKAKQAHYEVLFVWVQTDPATAKSRALRKAKDDDNRTLTSDQYDKLVRQFSAPTAIEKPLVISGKHTYATQAKVVLKRLSAPRAEISSHAAAPVRTEEPRRRGNIIVR